MLGKLIKHELKAMARFFLPLFLIALALTPITRLTVRFDNFEGIFKSIPAFIIAAYVISLIAIMVTVFILVIYRFYKSMVSEEGYLTHTLPVTTEQLIISKMIASFVWTLASIAVVGLSLFLMFFSLEDFSVVTSSIQEAIRLANATYPGVLAPLATEFCILFLVGIFITPLTYYASIAIGQLICKNKVLGSVIGFFIIQFAGQFFSLFAVPFSVKMAKIAATNDVMMQFRFMSQTLLPVSFVMCIVVSAILFVITDLIFKKKLNLE